MWYLYVILISLTSYFLVASKPTHTGFRYAVKEAHNAPRGWERVRSASEDYNINLRIALKQSNFDGLEKALAEVSDPGNPRYGQHLSAKQVEDYVQPSKETWKLVHEWLAGHGHNAAALAYSHTRDWIKLSLPIRQAERLLDTKYSVYRYNDGSEVVRATQWSLPAHLHAHIETIQPTNSFSRMEAEAVRWREAPANFITTHDETKLRAVAATDLSPDGIRSACNATNITPGCLKMLYGTNNYKPRVPAKSKIGYCNYLEETTISTDMAKFISTYLPAANGSNVNIQVVSNGQNQQVLNATKLDAGSDVEGNLDGQTIMGQVWPIPITAYNTGGRPNVTTPYTPRAGQQIENEPYLDWLEYMQSVPQNEIPQTISISYGDDEQSVPPAYARRVCQTFAQLGSRGVTILASSGDAGVGTRSPTSNQCEIYSNPQVASNATPNFMPAFPASCPYVTAVGATRGQGTGSFNMEVAAGYPSNVSNYASGGGFSNYFSRPAWQDSIVRAYMANLTAQEVDPKMYNTSGRAYPDLAANGQQYSVVWNGRLIKVDGTSASAPTMASIVALLNDDLMANGRPPLGFMNPWLYMVGRAGFTDIVSGSAKGCGVAGFPAKAGWDAVTGFGTPNFPALQRLAVRNRRTRPGPPGGGFIDSGRRPHGPGGRRRGGGWSWGNTWF